MIIKIKPNHYFIFSKVPEPDGLIPVNLNLINDLWVPNVFIYNLKSFQVSIFPNGLIQLSD